MKRVLISHFNHQQQKAQTLSGWSNFVGKQVLFDQLNKLKRNMYANNGRQQHQSNGIYNASNSNNRFESEDEQMGVITSDLGESKSIIHTDDEDINTHHWNNMSSGNYNTLTNPGKL